MNKSIPKSLELPIALVPINVLFQSSIGIANISSSENLNPYSRFLTFNKDSKVFTALFNELIKRSSYCERLYFIIPFLMFIKSR